MLYLRTLVLLVMFIFFGQSVLAGVGVEPAKNKKAKKIYILSIGFSPESGKGKNDMMIFTPCSACITDANGIAAYFASLRKNPAAGIDSVVSLTYTSDITIDTLYKAFAKIQSSIQPDDIFIFYYASIGWGMQVDDKGNKEGFYAINNLATNKQRENYVFTLSHLKTLTDRIAAKSQLIIFDTGEGDVILPDYYRNFFSDNISEALFSKKNRVIICPEKMSGESKDASGVIKGDMFKVISNLPDSFNVLHLFDTLHHDTYKSFLKHWYDQQLSVMANIKIIEETEYLRLLSFVKPESGSEKRGLTIKQKAPVVDSNIATRKKKVIIVATSNYEARDNWALLRNPVNDGRDAARVFSSLGYEVTPLYNKPKDSILSAISELIDNEIQNPYSQYIIYFAGHGYYDQRQKAGYIVCSDSKPMKDMSKPSMTELNSYIDYTVLFRNLDQLNKVILITDVCFGGTSLSSMLQGHRETDPEGEAAKLKNPFKRVLASGIKEVDDFIRLHNGSISNNSPFAAALLDILQKEGSLLSFEELYAKLKTTKHLNPTPIESYFGNERLPNMFTF
jgi:hypothetical protein